MNKFFCTIAFSSLMAGLIFAAPTMGATAQKHDKESCSCTFADGHCTVSLHCANGGGSGGVTGSGDYELSSFDCQNYCDEQAQSVCPDDFDTGYECSMTGTSAHPTAR